MLRARSERSLHPNAARLLPCRRGRQTASCSLQLVASGTRTSDTSETREGKEEEENGVGAVQAVARSAILALGRVRARARARLSGGAESCEGHGGRPAVSRDNSGDALRFFVRRTRARVTRHAFGWRDASIITAKSPRAYPIERFRGIIDRGDASKIVSFVLRSRACLSPTQPVGDNELSR